MQNDGTVRGMHRTAEFKASCHDCKWVGMRGGNMAQAKDHARDFQHSVSGSSVTIFRFNGKPIPVIEPRKVIR